MQDKEKKLELIEVLRTVTEGKIYVENERARVTRTLAAIYEKEDNLEKAAKVLQELQVSVQLIDTRQRNVKLSFKVSEV